MKPTIIRASHTDTTQPERFEDTSRGQISWHTLFSSHLTPTTAMSAGIAYCPPKTGYLAHHRHSHDEIYYIVSGQGRVVVEGIDYEVAAGDSVFIPGDAEHGVCMDQNSKEGLKWLYVFAADFFGDVKYRFRAEEKEA
ncbi:RmlC-like cupin [Myriangium duriaei CBS 260.36]|uniref:RmlC-like cupin n=1 Tax=Myriangium duriaei CBS 260.36 TaxID=1168546 RepID=A0A9P4MKH2_9PEZI|nr:RmlC-like cupin [Myriangium duriaei CBS 260.36]